MSGHERRSRRRRSSDHGWRVHVRENWYRDAWLLIITLLLLAVGVKALDSSASAKRAVSAVQRSRLQFTRGICDQQNTRNVATKRELLILIAALPASEQRQAQSSVRFTDALIDALAPHQDCNALVARARVVR